MQPSALKVLTAGLLGTLAMTMVGVYVAPLMGMPPMNPATMLAAQMGGILLLGWAGHLMIGIILAFAYWKLFLVRLPGPAILRGALFSLLPWLMAQIVVMPMMGVPVFSGSAFMAGGSLIGHLMYGSVVGAVIGSAQDVRSPLQTAQS